MPSAGCVHICNAPHTARFYASARPRSLLTFPCRVHSLTYLGAEASFTNFEMQTCALRQRMCTQVRHRLTKLLHSSKLRWCHRVALYRACIRSSQLFSQHAAGLTAAVLRRLESTDARGLRAVARSPALRTRVAWRCDKDCGSAPLQRLSPNCLRAGCAAAKMLLAAGSFEIS